ncbi:MAG: hypothetical protein JWR83_305 [Aeromicrobium sp.]|nr:hypothetical protein [Aeromicrobium sp.]
MRTRLGVAGVVLVALASLAACSSGSNSAKPTATAGPKTGNLLVHGVVYSHGKPVRGAAVGLMLWPDPDDTPEGEIVDTWSSDSVTSDAAGDYAIKLDPDSLKSKYFNGEYLNFEIDVSGDGLGGSWNSTVFLVKNRVWRSDEQALVGDPALSMNFDFGKPSVTTTDSFGDHESEEWAVVPE